MQYYFINLHALTFFILTNRATPAHCARKLLAKELWNVTTSSGNNMKLDIFVENNINK